MKKIVETKLFSGCFYIQISEHNFNLLCSCPATALSHLEKKNFICDEKIADKIFKTGANSILLSDVFIQNNQLSNLSEKPIFHMFYKQNLLNTVYKNKKSKKPIIIGDAKQIDTQLEYITRGNYGLLNDFEFTNLDLKDEDISNIMDSKLYFDFINEFSNNDLLDLKYLEHNEKIEIRDNIFIQRLKPNVFKLFYENEEVLINLNLEENEKYDSSYEIAYKKVSYEDFSIIHTDEVNPNEEDKVCSSILIINGKIYLIDAPANIISILNSLGIGLNEIEGVFNTNSHDDNFSGLSTLLLRDRKIKYFSSKLVKFSVMKKLSSLLRIPISSLNNYFEFINLEHDVWNKIDTFEVKPFLSIDSIESNILYFQCLNEKGVYKSYAHLNNIPSKTLLSKMMKDEDNDFGLSQSFYETSYKNFYTKADIKKIQYRNNECIDTKDLEYDLSAKLILSNTKDIKRSHRVSSFASNCTDILIPASKNYHLNSIKKYLNSYFRTLSEDKLDALLKCKIISLDANTVILEENKKSDFVYLVLSGSIKRYNNNASKSIYLSSGALIAYTSVLVDAKMQYSYKTNSYVNVLEIPINTYLSFVKQNKLESFLITMKKKIDILSDFSIFNTYFSFEVINNIINNILIKDYSPNSIITDMDEGLCLIVEGEVNKFLYDQKISTILKKDFFGERNILDFRKINYMYRAKGKVKLYIIPKNVLNKIPILYWKIFTKFQKNLVW